MRNARLAIILTSTVLLVTLSSTILHAEDDVQAFAKVLGGPTPIVILQPHYPLSAAEANLSGWVVIKFTITDTGATTSLSPTAGDFEFARVSIDALSRWKYSPRNPNDLLIGPRKGCAVFVYISAGVAPNLSRAPEECRDIPRYEEPIVPDWVPKELPT